MRNEEKLAELEKEILGHLDKAKKLASRCSFWNDVAILDALISNEEVLGHKSPLRDKAIFPELPSDLFQQTSRQVLFAATALIARYGEIEDFTSWSSRSQTLIKISHIPTFRISLSRLRNPCNIWVSLMRAYLALGNHRLLTKDVICEDLFVNTGGTCLYENSRVRVLTARSVKRYEALKKYSPFSYRFEALSQGQIHSLCKYYGPIAKGQKEKYELSKILSFGYSLYLLARIHRIQKPNQIMTFLSTDAIFANLFDAAIGLPGPTDEEKILGTNTDQPLYYRAQDSVNKLLGLAFLKVDSDIRRKVLELFEIFVFDPMSYKDPFLTLPYNCVILQPTSDGCVFFDDVEKLIPVLVADRLLDTGKLRGLQGEAFRNQIEDIVRSSGYSPFRVSEVKVNDRIIGDVDVGFIKDDCLCLIECKDVVPYPLLLLDNKEDILRTINHRDKGYISWIDKNLKIQEYFSAPQNLTKLGRDKRFDNKLIKKVTGFIVSNRPIFIYLTPDIFLTSSIPKIMIKEELQVLLNEQWDAILPSASIYLS